MYGSQPLPTSIPAGLAGTAGGLSIAGYAWIAVAILTIAAVVMAAAKLVPRTDKQ